MEKSEKPPKGNSFETASVDDWLDEKKKLDGAEGLWRIHDELYDFTVWSRTHPGGKFLLDVSRMVYPTPRTAEEIPGTDITEAFETHHFSNKPEALLQNYYKRKAASPRNISTTFHENGFFKVFKRRVSKMQLATAEEPLAVELLSDSLAATVFLTGLLGVTNGITWTIASGVFLGLLSATSHSFFHMKDNWRLFYFNLSLMSSREWRIRHVLSHHQYRNTILDAEISFFKIHKSGRFQVIFNVFRFPVFAHIQFLKRCLDVFLSKKLQFHAEELVVFSLPLFLYFFGGMQQWKTFVTWNLIIMIGAFIYCCINSNFFRCEPSKNADRPQREGQDFGVIQLWHIQGHPKENQSALSFLNSFRGNILHYLGPVIKWETFDKVIPIFEKTANEFGFLRKNSKGFLNGLENGMPQGHVFFS